MATELLFPPSRIVAGSLYKANDKDFDGKPLIVKTGANAGQARVQFFFAIAIPKNPGETHWSQTAWGAKIWAEGHTAFPQAAQRPDFAWKIEDGDSMVPNKRNRKPAENEGWAGHWVVKLSGGFAPKVYRQEGTGFVQALEPDYVKPGYFVEVSANVAGNNNQSNPGVYLNYGMVCFRGYGPEIVMGPNVNEVGFGAAPLPAGASAAPLAAAIPMTSASTPPVAAPVSAAPPPPPVPVTPNPQFLQVPPAPTLPPVAIGIPAVPGLAATATVAAPPPLAPVRTMTAKANGASYESFRAGNWTDEQMIAQGYMTA